MTANDDQVGDLQTMAQQANFDFLAGIDNFRVTGDGHEAVRSAEGCHGSRPFAHGKRGQSLIRFHEADQQVFRATDLGIGFCVEHNEMIVHEAAIVEPLMLAVAPDHPLASASSVRLNDIVEFAIALPNPRFEIRRSVDRIARQMDITLNAPVIANSFGALRDYARSGGVTILPSRAFGGGGKPGSLIAIPLDHPELSNTTLDVIRLRHWRMPRIIRLYLDALLERLSRPNRA